MGCPGLSATSQEVDAHSTVTENAVPLPPRLTLRHERAVAEHPVKPAEVQVIPVEDEPDLEKQIDVRGPEVRSRRRRGQEVGIEPANHNEVVRMRAGEQCKADQCLLGTGARVTSARFRNQCSPPADSPQFPPHGRFRAGGLRKHGRVMQSAGPRAG